MLRLLKVALEDVVTRKCGNCISLGNTGEDCEFYIIFDADAALEFANDVLEIIETWKDAEWKKIGCHTNKEGKQA